MALSITYKIRSGTLFLLLLLILSGSLGVYYQVTQKKASEEILKDNYLSLDYCHAMQRAIDSMHSGDSSMAAHFSINLAREQNNITEPGESEAVQLINRSFHTWREGNRSDSVYRSIQSGLQRVLLLNMQSIEKKNARAMKVGDEAYAGIILVFSAVLLVGLVFVFNFPGIVVTPIKKLTRAIQEISAKNYQYRIHLDNTDEFGQLATAFNTMSERLEEFENSNLNKIIFEKTRAEAVINSLKDASIGIDKHGKILFANEQALLLLGLSKEATIGKHATEISAQNDLFRFLFETDSTTPFKIVVDGKENFYTKEQIEVQQEDAASKVIILKNITSFKELDVAKTNFIATVSHELKTPLASTDFSLKLLEDNRVSSLSEEQKELVKQIKSDNQRMLRILSELLNMSQVEAGRIQLNIQQVSPYPIIETCVAAMAGLAKEKEITIRTFVADNLGLINVDPDKISWVLNNLFTNAIKFSPPSSEINLQVRREENCIRFAVTDRGPGIEKKYQEKIFDRYFQVPGRSDKTGSGIGLAICREFVEAMGGKIWLQSEANEGSTFGFDIVAVAVVVGS